MTINSQTVEGGTGNQLRSEGLREDVLVSVCFGELPSTSASFAAVAALARDLDTCFRFREIIVVIEESQKDAYFELIRSIDNVRLFTTVDGTPFYRKRAIAAGEAIGDVVLIASAGELTSLDAVAMIERATYENRAVLASCAAGRVSRIVDAPLILLGHLAGFNVRPRDLQSLALPRALLNLLMNHPDPDLALRFLPRNGRFLPFYVKAAPEAAAVREYRPVRRRLALLQKLLVYLAPSLLTIVTLTSALLAMSGIIYAFYVVGAWMLVRDLQPGWTTLSGMLSLTASFLGVSIMGLSLGLQQLLSRAKRDGQDDVVSELNRVDLFARVADELNVDLQVGSSVSTDRSR